MYLFDVLNQNPLFLYIFVGLFSLCVGSFLNVVIYRTPKVIEAELKADYEGTDRPKFNIAFPASHCPQCNNELKAWHNIPVISYLLLKGKCAFCKKTIPARYPLVELATMALSLIATAVFPAGAQLVAVLIFTWMLISLTMIDYDTYLLPDRLTLPLLWLGLVANTQGLFTDLHSAVWGAIAGYGVLWLVFWLFKLVTGKDGMGYGDFKLLAALGAWLGWQALPNIILASSAVGAILGIVAIIAGRDKNKAIPFGPYLAIAGGLQLYFGNWALHLLGL